MKAFKNELSKSLVVAQYSKCRSEMVSKRVLKNSSNSNSMLSNRKRESWGFWIEKTKNIITQMCQKQTRQRVRKSSLFLCLINYLIKFHGKTFPLFCHGTINTISSIIPWVVGAAYLSSFSHHHLTICLTWFDVSTPTTLELDCVTSSKI